jgi:hypothetical protein
VSLALPAPGYNVAMSTTPQPTTSRRHALALAAALTATIFTAVVAIGGFGRGASRPAAPLRPRVVVQAPAPAAPAAPTLPVKWADD